METQMIDAPQVLQSVAQLTAYIQLVVPRNQIQIVMGPGIHEVFATLEAQGIAPAGPWLTHHLRTPSDSFDFEICVPVSRAITPAGRVKPGQLRAAKVARTVYRGPYEGLGKAWGEFRTWIDQQGHQRAEDLWECYVKGPESSSKPDDWETQLNQPLMD
jgi:effector-binding domain-containing protein